MDVFYQITLDHRFIKNFLFNLQEKQFFYFSGKIAKNSCKINQSHYHGINSRNILQMRNTNDV